MDTAQWAQGNIGVVKPPMEGSNSNSKPPPILERKVRPQKDQALNCPRCNSTNTKFCYYNNYSLSQPRYFCKTCRRYWTEGGTLRNVPVGGGSRKNKRSTPSSSISTKKFPDLSTIPNFPHSSSAAAAVNSQNPKMIHQGQDLNLAYPPPPPPPPSVEDYSNNNNNNNGSISKFIEVPYNSSEEGKRGLNYFIPNISSGFPNLQEFKPGLGFTIHEGFENNGYNGGIQGIHQEGTVGARILFPFEDLKQQVPTSAEFDEQNRSQGDHATPGYWNGMLGGGSW